MKKIDKLIQMKFNISWEIIRLGWIGPGDFLRQLSVDDINSFAELKIDDASGNELEHIAELCVSNDEESITESLRHLAPGISERTVRIWRILLLTELLESLPDDPLNGLLELTDFWSKFGYPADSPHIIQGVDNKISPTKYYTKENYTKILSNHKIWVAKEIEELRQIVDESGS